VGPKGQRERGKPGERAGRGNGRRQMGPVWQTEKREGARGRWEERAGARPTREKGKRGGCWALVGPCGSEEGKRKMGWAERGGLELASFILSPPFLHSNIQTNSFEFK
jgi:hypothetical protein